MTPFRYNYHEGPRAEEQELASVAEGNCQLAVQYYFHRLHALFLPPTEIFPDGHWESAPFLMRDEGVQTDILQPSDVLYAEAVRRKNGMPLRRDRSAFPTQFDWLIHLHMAIYVGPARDQLQAILPSLTVPNDENLVLHANWPDKGIGLWPLERFVRQYTIVAVRRILHSDVQNATIGNTAPIESLEAL